MDDHLSQLRALTDQIHPLHPAEWDAFAHVWTLRSAARKEILTAAGSTEKYLYVLLKGVQRIYYSDDQDREATVLFTYPPSFGGVLDSFLQQCPSAFAYETLTPSTFLRASFPAMNELMNRYPAVERLVRVGLTGALAGVMRRLAELQCFSAEEKFRRLMERSPHILTLIPHKYIASYLGMDPTNFSKLINRIRI